jgi:hypothetical protein
MSGALAMKANEPTLMITVLELRIFLVVLVFILLSPVISSIFVSREHVYRGFDSRHMSRRHFHNEIFVNKEPIGVAILVSSQDWTSFHTPAIEYALSKRFGRPLIVRTFGMNGACEDQHYFLLQDLLSRRQVKFVLLGLPVKKTDDPHFFLHQVIQLNDTLLNALPGLSLKDKVQLFALSVIGAPRQIAQLRTSQLIYPADNTFVGNKGAYLAAWGRNEDHESFTKLELRPKSLPLSELIHKDFSGASRKLQFKPLTREYQEIFFQKTLALLRERGVDFALVTTPRFDERAEERAIIRLSQDICEKQQVRVLTVPPKTLFSGVDEKVLNECYYNDMHVNLNGSEFYTATILPAIIELIK